jgi:cytidylate kinase
MAFVVAIDGPAASGKGVLSQRLGARLGLPVLDTGLLYRAVGARALAGGGDPDDEDEAVLAAVGLDLGALPAMDLAGREAGELASRVAVHPRVRSVIYDLQRAFGLQSGGAILDGRDIGTVIFPEAAAKLFVTASPEVRAMRRWRQLVVRDPALRLEQILADIVARDARDSSRAVAPLRPATDAVLLDTTDLDIEQVFDAALRIVEAARDRRRP